MARNLNDVQNFLSLLSSEKATERKQGASKLEVLLKDGETVIVLDRYSSNKKSNQQSVTWDSIVHRVSKFLLKEYQIGNESKIKDAGSLYQFAIQIAEKRGAQLKSNLVFSQLFNILDQAKDDSFLVSICSNVLNKYLLSKRCHRIELTATRWHDFVEFYCGVIIKWTSSKQVVQYATILHELLKLGSSMPYVVVDIPFQFFNQIFTKLKSEKNSSLLEELISSFNKFLNVAVMDWKYKVDATLETLFPSFLHYFQSSIKNNLQSLQYELSDLFILWVENHKSIKELSTEEHNIQNTEKKQIWLEHMKKLYQVIESGIIQLHNTVFQITNVDNGKFYDVSALVMHQIMIHDNCVLPINNPTAEVRSKKRRLNEDLPYKNMLHQISFTPDSNSTIAWLNILRVLVKHKQDWLLSYMGLDEIYGIIKPILLNIKRSDIARVLLELLKEVIPISNTKHLMREDIVKKYQQCFEFSLKMVRSKKHEHLCFELAKVIWKAGYRDHNSHIYRLYTIETTVLSSNAILLLCYLMETSYFPELMKYEFINNFDADDAMKKYPLRKQLFTWLLPRKHDTTNRYQFFNLKDRRMVKIWSCVLVCLLTVSPVATIQMSSNIIKNVEYSEEHIHGTTKKEEGTMERNGTPLRKYKTDKNVEKYFLLKIDEMYTEVIDSCSKKPSSSNGMTILLEDISQLFTLNIHLLLHMNKIKDGDHLTNKLKYYNNLIIKRLVNLLVLVVKSQHTTKQLLVSNCLEVFENLVIYSPPMMKNILQQEITDLLANIMSRKTVLTPQLNEGLSKKKSSVDDFMELDDHSPTEAHSPLLTQEEEHPLHSTLGEKKACVQSLNILTHLVMHTQDNKEERSNLLQSLKEKVKDKDTSIQMFISFLKILKEYKYDLMVDELLIILSCVKCCFGFYHNDQDVCEVLLNGVLYLIDQLEKQDTHQNLTEQARLLLVKILGVICSLRNEKYSPKVRKMLVKIIAAITQINDVNGMWKLEVKNQNNDGNLASATSLLCQLILDDCMAVRSDAIQSIKYMFQYKSYGEQVKAYSYLKNILKKFHKAEKSAEVNEDQSYNQVLMIVMITKQILCNTQIVEKQTLWILWEFLSKGVLKQSHVFQVVEEVAKQLAHDDITSYIETRIDYLLKMYLERDYDILEFPSQCLHMSLHEFLSSYYRIIIPYLLLHSKHTVIESIQEHLNVDMKIILCNCLPNIVLLTFPAYYKHLQSNELTDDEKVSLQCLHDYQKLLTSEVFNEELKNQFADIFKILFMHIYDEENKTFISSKYTKESDCFTFFPPLSSELVGNILTSIASCYSEPNNTVMSVLTKNMSNIPYLLNYISIYILKPSVYIEQLNFMKIYYCFVVLLLKQFDGLQKTCAYYITQELIHRLVTFINNDKNKENRISDICFDLLDTILKMVPQYKCILAEVSKNIYLIVNELQQYILNNTSKSYRVKRLFSILILNLSEQDNMGDLKDALCTLDLFPQHPDVKEFNAKLKFIRSIENPMHETQEMEYIYTNLSSSSKLTITNAQIDNLERVLKNTCKLKTEVGARYMRELMKLLFQFLPKLEVEGRMRLVDCFGLMGPSILTSTYQQDETFEEKSEAQLKQYHHYKLIDKLVELSRSDCRKVSSVALDCLLKTLTTFNSGNHAPLKFLKSFKYIAPFLKGRKKKNTLSQEQISGSLEELQDILLQDELFIHYQSSYKEWITKLVTKLLLNKNIIDPFYENLLKICEISTDFSQQCFPYLIESILSIHNDFNTVLTTVLDQWIASCLNHLKDHLPDKDILDKMGVIVNLIQYLHCLDDPDSCLKTATCWDNKFHLSLNYLNVAEIAKNCSAFYPAAFFSEILLDPILQKSKSDLESSTSIPSQRYGGASLESTIVGTEELSPIEKKCWKQLYYDICKNIGEKDMIYGVDTSFLSFEKKRLQTYKLEKDFSKALVTNDAISGCHGELLVNNLLQSSLHNTAYLCAKGLCQDDTVKFAELQFESAWKTGIWEDVNISPIYERSYHGNIHHCLTTIRSDDSALFDKYITDLKSSLLGLIREENFSSFRYKEFLSKCTTVCQLQNTGYFILRDDIVQPETHDLSDEFHLYEESFNITTQALKIGCHSSLRKDSIAVVLLNHLQNYSKLAHHAKRYQICERIMHDVQELQTTGFQVDFHWQIDEAKLYWTRDERNHAIFRLKGLLNEMESGFHDDSAMYPLALSLYGQWLGETKSKNPVSIMEDYLEPAIELMEGDSYKGLHSPVEAYHSLAKYADEQYQNILDYIKSPAFHSRQAVIKKNKIDVMRHAKDSVKSTDMVLKRYYLNVNKQCDEDEKELTQLVLNKRNFLKIAVKYYSKCLHLNKKYEMKILRLCSLWFTNYSDVELSKEITTGFSLIQSDNFLLIMYQLAARLGTNMTKSCLPFKEILENVIIRCINDHPHHSLFILLALCNADIDKLLATNTKKTKLSNRKNNNAADKTDKVRIDAAKEVLSRIRANNLELVQSAEQLAHGYVELAYWDVTHLKKEKGPFQIEDNKLIRKINNLKSVAIPTAETPIDPSCEYKNIVYTLRFDTHFALAGGVNLPKIITCIGSDGKKRKQLVKGRDDLRQDAVMQQVFGVVNKLLMDNTETKSLNLTMRTYKVVPLSQKSGLLQWCDGTIPLGNYLVNGQGGISGAHQRYYPRDLTARECREKLTKASGDDGTKSKYNVFMGIQNQFHPVFRYFFLENYKDADIWFHRRLNYIRSVAVCSMVGYIVGLGDRHCQNILIDCSSAEMIHIDLGVAFEQGKMLPTPETIPFRLTRDIVDGMGVLGIEGVYRRCCEKTLQVLRHSKEALITIVEVLLYDPLSQWNISPEKARKLQRETSKIDSDSIQVMLPTQLDEQTHGNDDSDKNKAAERVLVRLEQKLTGYEDHTYLGCEGQVNYLIQEARSVRNLCKLFVGWQPWL